MTGDSAADAGAFADIVAARRAARRHRRGGGRGDRRAPRTVAVTGGAGYIGSLLVRRLLGRGYQVRVIDNLLYGDGAIRAVYGHPNLTMVVTDFRRHEGLAQAFVGVDAVAHLGAIVGDPACAIDDEFTLSTNLDATRLVAGICRALGVPRLVFASTCSVYGASDEILDEESALHPVSLYARSKIAAEETLLGAADTRTAPVVLRFATAYGASPRPRFDLAVNVLTARAVAEGRATIFGGEQWRPFVHVDDIARAILAALEAPLGRVGWRVFNVGAGEQNHRLAELGDMIRAAVPTATIVTDPQILDPRNYHVRFDRIRAGLGFTPVHTLPAGIAELAGIVADGAIGRWTDPRYDNHASLREILHTARPTMVRPPTLADPPRPLAVAAGAD